MIDWTQSYLIKLHSTLSRCSNSQQSHNLHSSVTENLQKYTDLKAELFNYVATERGLYSTISCYPQTVLSHINCMIA